MHFTSLCFYFFICKMKLVIVLSHYTSKEYMPTTQHEGLTHKYVLLLFARVVEETKKETKDQGMMLLLFTMCCTLPFCRMRFSF